MPRENLLIDKFVSIKLNEPMEEKPKSENIINVKDKDKNYHDQEIIRNQIKDEPIKHKDRYDSMPCEEIKHENNNIENEEVKNNEVVDRKSVV